MYKIQDFAKFGIFHAICFQIKSKKTTFTMAMQDVTIWWSKNYNFACLMKFQVVQIIQPNISKIELNNFVAHHFS